MSFLSSVKLSEYNSKELRNPAVLRRQKLSEKIMQQLKLVADPNYRPIKTIWNVCEDGSERLFDKPMRIKPWWVEKLDGTVMLTVRYGSRPLELAKGKNAIELCDKQELTAVLNGLNGAVLAGELDAVIEANLSERKSIVNNKK